MIVAEGCGSKSGGAASTAPAEGEGNPTIAEGQPAPDFTLDTLDGGKVKLSDLKDKVVVLDFWATWCPPCRLSLPHIDQLARNPELAAKGLKVLGVNETDDKARAASYVKEKDFAFTVPVDEEGALMRTYRLQGIPTTVVVARGGKVHKVFFGYNPEKSPKELEDAVAEALKQDAPK